jgi:hypothetical protein
MRPRVVVLVSGFALALAFVRPCRAIDNLAAQERLGGRIGYIETFDGLYEYYGPGWDVTLYFNERIHSRFLLEIDVGAIYLGDVLDPELDDFLTGYDDIESEMRIFYFSLGGVYGFPLGSSNYNLTTGLAVGVYAVSMAFKTAFVADDLSDQYFGGNASLGIARRVATNWTLEATCVAHYFDTDENLGDLLWYFTNFTAEDPILLGLAFGLVIDLR